ncbi:hypothetical protein V2J09_003562 [Rumex salicifolius]
MEFRSLAAAVKDLLRQQGMQKALLEEKPNPIKKEDWDEMQEKTTSIFRLCLGDLVIDLKTSKQIWDKLEKIQKEKQTKGKNKQISKSKVKNKVVCFGCGKTGHFKRDCTNRKQYSENNFEGSSKSANMVQNDSSESGDSDMHLVTSNSHTDSCILDSDDKTCGIVGIGQIKVRIHDGIIRMLTEVRHSPALKKNSISLNTLHVNGFD